MSLWRVYYLFAKLPLGAQIFLRRLINIYEWNDKENSRDKFEIREVLKKA